MSVDPKFGRYCDECGDTINKAHRVYSGRDYCTKCYMRVFVPKTCANCGKSARVHRLLTTPPVCRQCANKGRVCIRCEKTLVKAGLISNGKPVCPSCVPFFRTPKPCGACGKISTRLSALPSLGIYEKVCDSCRYKVTHRTCSVCRRYRKVAGITDKGSPHCITCVPGFESSHNCPQCGIQVAGSGNGKCIACLNSNQLEKEAMLLASSLSRDWMKSHCVGFAKWLWLRHKKIPNLCAKYRANQLIIQQIDATFVEESEISSTSLLNCFGTAKIRQHLLLSQYLQETLGFQISSKEKADASDTQRIRQNLLDNMNKPWGYVLVDYSKWLSFQGISILTRRLYFTTAASFCKSVQLHVTPWAEEDARRFLRANPGCVANLTKFFVYCRDVRGWSVAMPKVNKAAGTVRPPRTVSRLRSLLAKVKKNGLEKSDRNTLCSIIAITLGLRLSSFKNTHSSNFKLVDGELFLHVDDEIVRIPDALSQIVKTYIELLCHHEQHTEQF